MRRLNAGQASIAVVNELQEQLRKRFTESEPFGGKISADRVQHRVGNDLVFDEFSTGGGEECEGVAWVSAIRRYRTEQFPAESFTSGNCGTQKALMVLVGVTRCSMTIDDNGEAADAERVNWEGVRGLDDSSRLDNAICAAGKELDDRGVILGWAVDAIEPVGPQGGAIVWVTRASFLLA